MNADGYIDIMTASTVVNGPLYSLPFAATLTNASPTNLSVFDSPSGRAGVDLVMDLLSYKVEIKPLYYIP